MTEIDTKNKILDTSETLFANRGFSNTSLRMITQEAGVNIAAVNYHFGSKDNLVGAIFERRIGPLNLERSKLLKEELGRAKENDQRPDTSAILKAFINPTVEMIMNHETRHFLALMNLSMTDPNEVFTEKVLPLLFPIVSEFLDAFCLALPEISKNEVMTRFQLTLGAMHHSLHVIHHAENRFKHFAGDHPETDPDIVRDRLIAFTTKGMEGT